MPFGVQLTFDSLTSVGFLAAVGGIILIDIVLSGDNALIIGAAAGRLPRGRRLLAIVWGGLGAIVFRIVLAAAATEVLLVPLLQALGGLVLMVIAVRMLLPQGEMHIQARDRFFPAMLTILIADATMSLDNVIAIGALAKGNLLLLAIGLGISMLVLFTASAIIARVVERLSILLDLAALVLAFTAANLILADPTVRPFVDRFGQSVTLPIAPDLLLQGGCIAFVLIVDVIVRVVRARRGRRARAAALMEGAPSAPDSQEAAAALPMEAPPLAETAPAPRPLVLSRPHRRDDTAEAAEPPLVD